MAGVAVVTDSTSSLPHDLAMLAGVRVIPLQVVVAGVSRLEGEIGPAAVARGLRTGQQVSTSRPTLEAFRALYAELAAAGHSAVVSAHLSGEISGTAAAAAVAGTEAELPVHVVDSQVIGMATGFAVLAGAQGARDDADAEQVSALIRQRALGSSTYFVVDDLEHLRRGGRIGAAAAVLGSALAVKPLLTVADGRVQPLERVRTASRALARLEELAADAVAAARTRGLAVEVAVHHLDDEAAAATLAERLQKRAGLAVTPVLSELSAVLGVHVGPGTLGVVVSPVC